MAGFAAKTEEKILKELENFGTRAERLPIWQLEPVVLEINELLASLPEVELFSVAGSFRRVAETSKDIDFIVATNEYEVVREAILKHLAILETVAAGDTKVSVILDREDPVSVDFRLVKREEYATALHHFTGSKDHNVRMRQLAKSMGKKLVSTVWNKRMVQSKLLKQKKRFLPILIYHLSHQQYGKAGRNLIAWMNFRT